jgi:DNA mismatch repair ATPase MutL
MNSFLIGTGIGLAVIITVGNMWLQLRLKNNVIARLRSVLRKERRETQAITKLIDETTLSSEQILFALRVIDSPNSNGAHEEIAKWQQIADKLYEAFKDSAPATISIEGRAAIQAYEKKA